MSSPPSPPLAGPSYMASPINTNHLVTVLEMEYVCPIGDDDSNSEPPASKKQKKWVSNLVEEWDLDNIMDIYGSEVGPRQVSSFISETVHSLFDAAYV